MKVLLIAANRERVNMAVFPLGLSCVAKSAIEAGHEARMVDLMYENEPRTVLRETIAEFAPEAIGISLRNIDDQNMSQQRFLIDQAKDAVDICREYSSAPVVLGGAGYSIFPESALRYCGADMGIQGEGEIAFPALLARLESGGDVRGVPGLFLPDEGSRAMRSFRKRYG